MTVDTAAGRGVAGLRWEQALADLALLGVAAVWGATFVMVKDAVAVVGPLTFLALRFLLATAAMAPLWLVRRRSASPGLWRGALRVGLFLAAGYALQTAGLQLTTAGRAGFVTGLYVVLVPLGAALVLRRSPAGSAWVGVVLATLGLTLLAAPGVLAESGGGAGFLPGDLLVLGCAFAFAAHILALGAVAARLDTVLLAAGQIAVAAVLTTVGALAFERIELGGLAAVWPAAAFTGVVCTVLAYTVQTRAQRFTSPTHTALIFSSEPVFAALFAWLLAGESLGGAALVGCALILAGMLVAQLPASGTGRRASAEEG